VRGDPKSNGRPANLDIGRSVRDELDSQYPPGRLYPIEDLDYICDFVYGYLTDLCADHITGYFERFAGDGGVIFRRTVSRCGPVSFLFDKVVYTCRIGPSISDPQVMCVNLAKAVATDVARPVERQVGLDVSGRYRSLRVYADDLVSGMIEAIAEISSAVLTAGDRWIETFVLTQLASLQDDALTQVYALVRRPFSADLARAIRIYLVDPARGGGVFMDEEARHDTLMLFSGHSYTAHEKAPIELLSGLLVARFDIQDTVARDIFPNMTTVVKNAMEIPSGTQVGLAQHIMYRSGGMVLQPLVALDKLWIEVAYPAVLRSRIEPVLESERAAIRSILTKTRFGNVADSRGLPRMRRPARPRAGVPGDDVAGLAGRFAGSFVAEFLK
jgi:hypothetical protein